MIAIALGFGLNRIAINNIWNLGLAICGFAVLYLPVAYVMDRRIIK